MANPGIQLSSLIAELRNELAQAKIQGEGADLRFQIEEAEIELQVVVTQGENDEVGVKFWVLNAGMKDSYSNATTQKIKLKLKVHDAVTGENPPISAKE